MEVVLMSMRLCRTFSHVCAIMVTINLDSGAIQTCPQRAHPEHLLQLQYWRYLGHLFHCPSCIGVAYAEYQVCEMVASTHVEASNSQVSSTRFSVASRPPNSSSLSPGKPTMPAKSLGDGRGASLGMSTTVHSHVSCNHLHGMMYN